MAQPYRPRTLIEALFDRPFVGSDNGDRGIGPTLGEDVGEPSLPAAQPRPGPKVSVPKEPEPKVFAARPRPLKRPAKPGSPEDKPDDKP